MKLSQATEALSDTEDNSTSVSPARRTLSFPSCSEIASLSKSSKNHASSATFSGPVYQALKGYSIFNQKAKMEAIVDFWNYPVSMQSLPQAIRWLNHAFILYAMAHSWYWSVFEKTRNFQACGAPNGVIISYLESLL